MVSHPATTATGHFNKRIGVRLGPSGASADDPRGGAMSTKERDALLSQFGKVIQRKVRCNGFR
jgi:hypothetical protein